ncbi:MAG TPA: hypothetical protein VEV44_04320, partial [Pseudoneobacillus sp.]|nr:hypothetical protein [Pseudoneobacillus sp.]
SFGGFMLHLLIGIILLIFAIDFIKILVELFTIGTEKTVKCKACSGQITSSSLKCHLCGTFQEKKWKKLNKISSYVEKLWERKMVRVIKKTNFWNGNNQ